MQLSVHTSRTGKRVNNKSDDDRRRGRRGKKKLVARLNNLAGDRRPNASPRTWHGPAVRTGLP